MRSRALVALTFVWLPLSSCEPIGAAASDGRRDEAATLEIRFLDVGQGDATLIRADGRVALIDAGASDRILVRLRELGVTRLDLLVASHNHADHIGGMDAILAGMPVGSYLDNGIPAPTRIQARVLSLVEEKGVRYLRATSRRITMGDVALRIVPSPLVGPDLEGQNDGSVSVIVERGAFRALLTGDSERPQIAALLSSRELPPVDVLKAAHHGSRNGVSAAWLRRLRPRTVVISSGSGNPYGHPHGSALRLYCAAAERVLRTDLHGEITVRVEPEGEYAVRSTKPQPLNGTPVCAAGPAPGRSQLRTRPGPRSSP